MQNGMTTVLKYRSVNERLVPSAHDNPIELEATSLTHGELALPDSKRKNIPTISLVYHKRVHKGCQYLIYYRYISYITIQHSYENRKKPPAAFITRNCDMALIIFCQINI